MEEGQHCNLHVSIHGCGRESVEWIFNLDYGKYAGTNNIIMLFPKFDTCPDMVGITGSDFGNKNGIQPRVIKKMIDRILEDR